MKQDKWIRHLPGLAFVPINRRKLSWNKTLYFYGSQNLPGDTARGYLVTTTSAALLLTLWLKYNLYLWQLHTAKSNILPTVTCLSARLSHCNVKMLIKVVSSVFLFLLTQGCVCNYLAVFLWCLLLTIPCGVYPFDKD